MKQYFAKVPFEFQENGITWLIISPHVHQNQIVGWYLLKNDDLDDPTFEYDDWFQDIKWAYQSALEDFGIQQTDWMEREVNERWRLK